MKEDACLNGLADHSVLARAMQDTKRKRKAQVDEVEMREVKLGENEDASTWH